MANKKLVLSLPGGGARGAIQLSLLHALDLKIKALADQHNYYYKGLAEYVSYVGGISIGALNAAAMAVTQEGGMRLSLLEHLEMFHDRAGSILAKSSFLPVDQPYFASAALEKTVQQMFDDLTFDHERLSQKLLITSYNLEQGVKTIFTNIGDEAGRRAAEGYAWDVDRIKIGDAIMCSTALPGLLPAKAIEYARDSEGTRIYHEIDGGFINSSPALDLLSSINLLEKEPLSNLLMLSIGTGALNCDLSRLHDRGIYSYMLSSRKLLAKHIKDAQKDYEVCANKFLEAAGGKGFIIDPDISMDDYFAAIKDTKEQAQKYWSLAQDFICSNDQYLNDIAAEVFYSCIFE